LKYTVTVSNLKIYIMSGECKVEHIINKYNLNIHMNLTVNKLIYNT